MAWLSYRWWLFVMCLYWACGCLQRSENHWERQGMRRVLGGRWGRWEVSMGGAMGTFKIWWPSPCEHYPAPPCVTSTEPLEIEEWQ